MALSAAGDVAIPELMEEEEVMEDAPVAAFPPDLVGQQWSCSCTAPEMVQAVGALNWCPTPPRSPERDASPREEVLQAPASFHPPPRTTDCRPICGRRRPTSTSSATATTTTSKASEDDDCNGIDGFFLC
ncbi:hypothetical protein D1007_10414 [Hordeum vulgare]|nr:hypothetical protein D1007_10414 [Hordeum vulgare]